MALLHREITDVQRQVQQLGTATLDKRDLAPMEQRFEDQTNKVVRSNADLAVRVGKLQEQIEGLRANLEVTTRQLRNISQRLAAAELTRTQPAPLTVVTPNPKGNQQSTSPPATSQTPANAAQQPAQTAPQGTPAQPHPSTPEELYQSAYQDYMRGNYDLSIQGFKEYLQKFPKTDLADNAQYWIGECYDAQDKEKEALQAFSLVLDKYPTSDKGAAAQLKKGLVYLKLGDQGQGVVNLQYVVYEHPGTKEADLAREKLRSLGITIR